MRALAAILVVGAIATTASAQQAATAPAQHGAGVSVTTEDDARPGPIFLGFSLGGGAIVSTCRDCDVYGGVSADATVGWAIVPRVALAAQISGLEHPRPGGSLFVHACADAVARVWLAPRWWLEAGAGIGRMSISAANGDPYVRSGFAASTTAALGWDVVHAPRFAFDLLARTSTSWFDDPVWNVTVSVGFDFWLWPTLSGRAPDRR